MKTKIVNLALVLVVAVTTLSAQNPERRNRSDNDNIHKLRQMRADNRGDNNFFTEEQKEAMKAIRLKSAQEVKSL